MSALLEISQKLIPEYCFHIFNRGVDGSKIFYSKENYRHFLGRYAFYTKDYLDTLSYCLIPNHFHLLVLVKSVDDILQAANNEYLLIPKSLQKELVLNGLSPKRQSPDFQKSNLPHLLNDQLTINEGLNFLSKQPFTYLVNHPKPSIKVNVAIWIVSNQLRKLFLSYSKGINSQQKRKGSLFQRPFRRKLVDNLVYLKWLVWYLHRNPVHHKLTKDFKTYPHSSFLSFMSNKPSLLRRDLIFSYFEDKEEFIDFHLQGAKDWEKWQHYVIE